MNSYYDYHSYSYGVPSPQDQASPSDYPYAYQAQPLARNSSSGGSSQASFPESPTYDSYYSNSVADGYADHQQYYGQEQHAADQYPVEYDQVPRNQSHAGSHDGPVCCLYPGCTARPFKRPADLHRHYLNTHAPDEQKPAYFCDYQRCPRSSDPFRRRDHFRDHLREYHREDICKRGATINEESLENRYASSKWWRCPRCLLRVQVSRNGFTCPDCKTSCEPSRKEKRRRS